MRKHLEDLLPSDQDSNTTYQHLRAISHQFRDGVLDSFFDTQSGLFDLTRTYGVF